MSLQFLIDMNGTHEVDRNLAAWVAQRIPRCPPFEEGKYRALGIVRNGALVAAAVYTDYKPMPDGGNICVNFAADAQVQKRGRAPTRAELGIQAPHWASRAAVTFLLSPPFLTWGCNRITAIIDKDFKASRRLCAGVGFTYEGAVREMLPGKRTACIYGLLKTEFLGGRFGPKLAAPIAQAA